MPALTQHKRYNRIMERVWFNVKQLGRKTTMHHDAIASVRLSRTVRQFVAASCHTMPAHRGTGQQRSRESMWEASPTPI
jgi:hypothetical protein